RKTRVASREALLFVHRVLSLTRSPTLELFKELRIEMEIQEIQGRNVPSGNFIIGLSENEKLFWSDEMRGASENTRFEHFVLSFQMGKTGSKKVKHWTKGGLGGQKIRHKTSCSEMSPTTLLVTTPASGSKLKQISTSGGSEGGRGRDGSSK
ncbi:hypothetical protein Tco_1005374, partial [Tanacetum coccineum]